MKPIIFRHAEKFGTNAKNVTIFDSSLSKQRHPQVSRFPGWLAPRTNDSAQSTSWLAVIVVNLNETVNADSRQSRAQQKIINGPTNEYEYG